MNFGKSPLVTWRGLRPSHEIPQKFPKISLPFGNFRFLFHFLLRGNFRIVFSPVNVQDSGTPQVHLWSEKAMRNYLAVDVFSDGIFQKQMLQAMGVNRAMHKRNRIKTSGSRLGLPLIDSGCPMSPCSPPTLTTTLTNLRSRIHLDSQPFWKGLSR